MKKKDGLYEKSQDEMSITTPRSHPLRNGLYEEPQDEMSTITSKPHPQGKHKSELTVEQGLELDDPMHRHGNRPEKALNYVHG